MSEVVVDVKNMTDDEVVRLAKLARNAYFRERRKANKNREHERMIQNRYWANKYIKEHGGEIPNEKSSADG